MLVTEADWIAGELARIADGDLFPLLNVGSSTADFRTRKQPQIDEVVFAPLRQRGGQVWHADLKAAPGVDIVGDLCSAATVEQVRKLGIRSALVSNVMEHVSDRVLLGTAIAELIPQGGYIIATGPNRFPYHPDPIDTGFRPDPDGVVTLFPGTTLVSSAMIDGGNWRQWDARERARSPSWTVIRALVPFYRRDSWLDAVRNLPYLLRHVKAYGVVLSK